MKHAYLIIAHNCPAVVETLLSMIDDTRNDIFIHIDARSSSLRQRIEAFRPRAARLHILQPAQCVYWGDISQVEVEYRLLRAAAAEGEYAYYHLLSGADLPLRSQDDIHAFFRANAGREFVSFWTSRAHQRDLARKVNRYYLFTRHLKDKGTLRHRLAAAARNTWLAVQKITGLRRAATWEFRKGPNWVSLTHECVEYLIAQQPAVMRRLRHTLCPDEIFVQTLVWNSPFRSRLFDIDDPLRGNMRLVDWERGGLYQWCEEDYDELARSPLLFARKFSDNTPLLLHRLRRRLEGE